MRRIATIALLIVAAIALWIAAVSAHHDAESATSVAIFDSNPSHLWNRLYATLLIREDRQGIHYGADSLDPLLMGYTRHLLEPKSHKRAIKVLDEFLETHGENLIHDPVRRALLTRDLWSVFDWSVSRTPEYPRDPAYDSEKRELQTRLAQILRRIALTPQEIQSLPDNYAQAVASGEFPKEYDPAHPERVFLPPDLFDQHGPWVEVTSNSGQELPAVSHVSFFSGRSRFLIFMRLPGGRKGAFDYFRQLWEFPQPWISRSDAPNQTETNPSLPSFPAGTEVALVRQMTLFDNQGNLVPAPITESVQIRVYRSVSPPDPGNPTSFDDLIARSGQAFYEIRMDQPRLLSARPGLREVTRNEKEIHVFNAMPFDWLEAPKFKMNWDQVHPILSECAMCHHGSGIHSLNSLAILLKPNFLQRDAGYELPPRWWEEDGTTYWKEHRYDWGLLSGYWKAGGPQ